MQDLGSSFPVLDIAVAVEALDECDPVLGQHLDVVLQRILLSVVKGRGFDGVILDRAKLDYKVGKATRVKGELGAPSVESVLGVVK